MKKRKVYEISVIDKTYSNIISDETKFYTSDTALELVFKLKETEYNFESAEIVLLNVDDRSLVTRPVSKVDKDFVYELDDNIIAHYGEWRGQLRFEQAGETYVSSPVKFRIENDLTNERPPQLSDVQSWVSLKRYADSLTDDLKQAVLSVEGIEDTFNVNELERQNQFTNAEQSRQTTFETNESERDETFNTNENTRQTQELEREKAEGTRQQAESQREVAAVKIESRQTFVENQFNSLQQELTDKDIVSAPEIIAARNGEENLKARLDKEQQEVTAQLAQTVQDISSIAGINEHAIKPVYDEKGKIRQVDELDGSSPKNRTNITYNANGTINTVIETILNQEITTTFYYNVDGTFSHVNKKMGDLVVYPDNLVGSIDNMLLALDEDLLFLSKNGGDTFPYKLDISGLGLIKYYHIFSDGSLLFCTHTKAYYTHDWLSYQESTVLDVDGNSFVPPAYDSFSLYRNNNVRQVVDGVEVLCWGNYSNQPGVQYENINLWYTVDKGETIKSCYHFGTVGRFPARHVHNVDFNPSDETFWALAGDEGKDGNGNPYSQVLKGSYDVISDSWTWNKIGDGLPFKWSMVTFQDGYAYWAWDDRPGGVVKCKYEDIADESKHELLFATPNDCVGVYIGERGDMVAIITLWGGTMIPRNFYYSPDQINWHLIEGEVPEELDYFKTRLYGIWGPNPKGKILGGLWAEDLIPLDDWNRKPGIWIDDVIKRAGFPDAFKPL